MAVIANRSPIRRIVRRARELGRAALNATQAAAVLKLKGELGDGVELAITPGWAAQDPVRALDLALDLPERAARADGRRLVLFFDEFQELASERRPYGDPDLVTKRMRAAFQRSPSVSFLFAGSLEHVMRDLFAPGHRAFSGFGASTGFIRSPPRTGPEDCSSASRRTTARSTRRRSRGSWSWEHSIRARRCGSPSRHISSPSSSIAATSISTWSSWATTPRSTATFRRWSRPSSTSGGFTRTRSRSLAPWREASPFPGDCPGDSGPRAQAAAARGHRRARGEGRLADRRPAVPGLPSGPGPARVTEGAESRSRGNANHKICVIHTR